MKKMAIWTSGRPTWPRFIIVRDDGFFWDGEQWTCQRRCARLYSDNRDVALAFRELEEEQFKDMPLRTFQVPLHVQVRAAEDIDISRLSMYLQEAVSILIDQDRCGTGPVPSSLVQLDVTWDEMQEVQAEKGGEA